MTDPIYCQREWDSQFFNRRTGFHLAKVDLWYHYHCWPAADRHAP